MKKIKLFSHTDLDGVGCNVLIRNLDKKSDIENLDYGNVNERIKDFIVNGKYVDYDYIFITDISVNEEVAGIIDEVYKNEGINIVLLDHHPTALWLNKYEWANVEENITYPYDGITEKTSGTELLYRYILCNYDLMGVEFQYDTGVTDFVTQVKRYDTWLWNTKYKDNKPKKLNDLFHILGKDRFIEGIEEDFYRVGSFISKYSLLLELEQEKIDKYVNEKIKEIVVKEINGYTVGIVFADHNQSELGNRLSEINSKLDLIAMIGVNTVSYRTIRDDINCSEFAKAFNGGGHPKASGSQISIELQNKIIDLVFNLEY